jgi:hypothetical protein
MHLLQSLSSSYVTILVLFVMSFNRKSPYSHFNSMAMVEKQGLNFINNTRTKDFNIKRRSVHSRENRRSSCVTTTVVGDPTIVVLGRFRGAESQKLT